MLAEVFCLKWVNNWVKTFCFVLNFPMQPDVIVSNYKPVLIAMGLARRIFLGVNALHAMELANCVQFMAEIIKTK